MPEVSGNDLCGGLRRFKPYPTYKDSGVEWLGKIPVGWEVKRLRHVVARIEQGWSPECENRPVDPDSDEWAVLKVGCVNGGVFRSEENKALPPRVSPLTEYEIRPGDVLVSRANTRDLLGSAALVVATRPRLLLCDKLYRIGMLSNRMLPHFLVPLLASSVVRYQLELEATGASGSMQNIAQGTLRNLCVSVPPIEEQSGILTFLDRETARIDAMVAKKERLIELLQEKRTALITRAVTKGLDPNVPMKGSGVEWLGKIPAHWQVAPVYSRYEVALGKMLDAKRVTGQFSGRYLRNVDVQWDRVDTRDLPEMDFAPSERERYLLRPGDLLVCEGGEVGRTAVWKGEIKQCFYQKAIHRVRPRTEQEFPRFFYYLMYMLAKAGVFAAGGNSNTIDHLTAVQLRHYRMPFTSLNEQRAIATFLDQETDRIDGLASKIRDAIDHLREFRTALISAAVTGKIDVRPEAA